MFAPVHDHGSTAQAAAAMAPLPLSSARPRLRPLHLDFGAEVEGIDLARGLTEEALAFLRGALRDHLLLVLPGQRPTLATQRAFAASLGGVATAGGADRDPDWRMDLALTARPSRFSILSAVDVEPGGCTTEFASLGNAQGRLGPWLQAHVEYLDVEHAPRHGIPATVHPLVRIEKETGRRALLLAEAGSMRVIGLPPAESDDLLHRLHAVTTHPAHVLRHRWRVGDVLVWDNPGLLHRTRSVAGGRLHRTLVAGDRPLGPRDVGLPWVSAG